VAFKRAPPSARLLVARVEIVEVVRVPEACPVIIPMVLTLRTPAEKLASLSLASGSVMLSEATARAVEEREMSTLGSLPMLASLMGVKGAQARPMPPHGSTIAIRARGLEATVVVSSCTGEEK